MEYSSTQELAARLLRQKAIHETASDRKGQRATDKPSRLQLEFQFPPNHNLPRGDQLLQTVVGYAYPPSTTKLVHLNPMDISELRLETHYRGRVLIVSNLPI